ncbi:hypothetical protein ES703_02142 [subsurface metagenome]
MSEQKAWTIETLKAYLPDPFRELLNFEDYPELIKVSTKKFMHGPKGKEDWGIIHKLLKQAGGAWVSEGKLSHWAVKKLQVDTESHAGAHYMMQKHLEDIKHAADYLLNEIKEGRL